MEDHKVDANAYNAVFSQTRERPKVAVLGPESSQLNSRNSRQLHHSVNIVPRHAGEQPVNLLLGASSTPESQHSLIQSPELRKLKQKFSKKGRVLEI